MDFPLTTAGDIAVGNLQSARQCSWSRFWQQPAREGVAEYILEQEHLTAQFLGDLTAFDRLDVLVDHLSRFDADSARTAFVRAQVASMTHRFAEAKQYLAPVLTVPEFADAGRRLALSIDQACGTDLGAVLEATNAGIRDYYLLPALDMNWGRLRMAEENGIYLDAYQFGALDYFYGMAERCRVEEASGC